MPLLQVHWLVTLAIAIPKLAKELVSTRRQKQIKHENLTINIGHLADSDNFKYEYN